jgi:hypothetical protein
LIALSAETIYGICGISSPGRAQHPRIASRDCCDRRDGRETPRALPQYARHALDLPFAKRVVLRRWDTQIPDDRRGSGKAADQRTIKESRDLGIKPDSLVLGRLGQRPVFQAHPSQARPCMHNTDEASSQPMPMQSCRKHADAGSAKRIPGHPPTTRLDRQQRCDVLAKAGNVRFRMAAAKHFQEILVMIERPYGPGFQIEQCQMRPIQINCNHLRRIRQQIGQRITSRRCDGDDPVMGLDRHGLKVAGWIFPNLGIDQSLEPAREESIQNADMPLCAVPIHGVRK